MTLSRFVELVFGNVNGVPEGIELFEIVPVTDPLLRAVQVSVWMGNGIGRFEIRRMAYSDNVTGQVACFGWDVDLRLAVLFLASPEMLEGILQVEDEGEEIDAILEELITPKCPPALDEFFKKIQDDIAKGLGLSREELIADLPEPWKEAREEEDEGEGWKE